MNYLALIGWSPGGDEELLPIQELARRFALDDVGHSAGVFDQEKLAWMNRHYMKEAAPARLAAEAARFFLARGYLRKRRTDEAMEYLVSVLPMAVGSVDRLEEIPDRLEISVRVRSGRLAGARRRAERAARGRCAGRSLRRCRMRSSVPLAGSRVVPGDGESRQGAHGAQKGKALFHPIRVALTGEGAGPELDLAVPAIERGAALPPSSGGLSRDRRLPRPGDRAFAARRLDATDTLGGTPAPRPDLMIIYGINPVLEALRGDACDASASDRAATAAVEEALALARAKRRGHRARRRRAIDRAAHGGVHQGIVAELDPPRDYSLRELVEAAAPAPPLLVVLDGVEDPHNVGAILRTVDAAGAHGIVRQAGTPRRSTASPRRHPPERSRSCALPPKSTSRERSRS